MTFKAVIPVLPRDAACPHSSAARSRQLPRFWRGAAAFMDGPEVSFQRSPSPALSPNLPRPMLPTVHGVFPDRHHFIVGWGGIFDPPPRGRALGWAVLSPVPPHPSPGPTKNGYFQGKCAWGRAAGTPPRGACCGQAPGFNTEYGGTEFGLGGSGPPGEEWVFGCSW